MARATSENPAAGNPDLPSFGVLHPSPAAKTIIALLIAAGLVGAVVLAFWPSLWNGFNYDDETNIIRNQRYRGLGAEQLAWMFTTFKAGHYQPLSWLSLGLDYVLWGDRPFGYHLTNLVLHAANAVLVFWLALTLIEWNGSPARGRWGGMVGAALAALLFAVHPLRVESVAWVTERRDELSSFFLFITVLLYLKAQRTVAGPTRRWLLAAAVAFFALSLLSRAMGVTLPVILLVLDWYPLKRLARQREKGSDPLSSKASGGNGGGTLGPAGMRVGLRGLTPFLEKLPFFMLAVAAAVIAPMAQKSVGAAALLEHHGIEGRVAQACYGLVFYVWKTVAPWGLVPMVELHPPLKLLTLKYGLSAFAVIVAALLFIVYARRYRALAAGALCYVILLSPVLGFVQSGQQEVADRYSYLPGVVIGVLIGGGIARLWNAPASRRSAALASVIACGVALGLGALTWGQCGVWRDPQTLWSYAIAAGPPCAVAHHNLGSVYGLQGRTRDARDEFIRALDINKRYPDAYYQLGNACTELGDLEMAEKAYMGALRIDPSRVTAWYHLGNARANQGKTDPAIEAYTQAASLRPKHAETWINLGGQYWKKGARDEAIAAYRKALEVNPNQVDARVNLGGALAATGRTEEGLAELREAVRIDPNHQEARRRLELLEAHLAP